MSETTEKYDYLLKVITAGDPRVGKSSLIARFSEDIFTESYDCTIGVDFKHRFINIVDALVKFQIWDVAGEERFHAIIRSYYRGVHIVFLVFDLTDAKSFQNISARWHEEASNNANSDTHIILVGNKCDLRDQRAITSEEAREFANQKALKYFEVSAKDGTGMEELFYIAGANYLGKNFKPVKRAVSGAGDSNHTSDSSLSPELETNSFDSTIQNDRANCTCTIL